MTKTSKRVWPRLCQWLNPTTYLDGWFALLERSRAALDRMLDYGFLVKKRSSYERKPNYLPQLEGLELRMLMTTVFMHTSAQKVNYNATAVIEADLSTSSTQTITVNYATADGTAVAGTDYTNTSGTLTFAPGATQATFTVPMLNKKESSNVTFTGTLSNPTNATLGSPTVDTVTIVNSPLTSAVVDANTDVVLPPNAPVSTPINTFSSWSMSLLAEVSGAAVSSYSWNFGGASDAGSISGSTTYNVTFTWGSFSGAARSDTISITETATIAGSGGSEQFTLTYPFKVTATNSTAWSTAPTSSGNWPATIVADQLNGQAILPAGPYAAVGQVDGSVQTAFGMPAYNPNAVPLELVYDSAVADPTPIFLVSYPLSASSSVPTTITAQLTMTDQNNSNVYTGSTIYYSPSLLNKGDNTEIALQATGLTMATGRYNWTIVTVATYSPTVTTTYSGSFNFINSSTTPTSVTNNPFGLGWSLANVEHLWTATGGVIIQNPNGTSLWFASSGGNYTAPPGDFSTLTLTSGVYTRTMPDGTKIKFNSSGQQTLIVDRNGNTTTFTYDTSGELTSVTDMNSQINTLTYSSGLATSIADPASRIGTLTYSSNDLTSIKDPGSNVWSYAYDGSNRLTTITDPRSNITTFTYNFASQAGTVNQPDVTTQTFAAEQLTGLATTGTGTSATPATAVLAATALATYTDPNSKIWTEYFDGLGFGRLVEAVDPLGDTALTYRNTNGLPWLSADGLGQRQRLFFDSSANVTKAVFADDSSLSSTYNSFAEPLVVTDPTGAVTTYSYDGNGRLTSVLDALNHRTTYTNYTTGLVNTIQNALSNTTTFAYDSKNRLSTVTDPLSHTQSWAYDSYSNVTAYTDQNSHITTSTYDALDELLTETVPTASGSATYTFVYDAVGNRTSAVSPKPATISYAFDAMNRLTQMTDALSNITTYSYDAAGNLTVVNDANQGILNITYTYDAAGRLQTKNNDGAVTTYVYDAAGRRTNIIDALSHKTTFTYDKLGRLLTQVDPRGKTTSYAYDLDGRVTTVTDPDSNTTTYAYNAGGLLTATTNANSYTATYSYDSINELTAMTDFAGRQTTYSYNANGWRTGETWVSGSYQATYTYDPAGNLTGASDSNSTYTFTYYNNNQLKQSVVSYPGASGMSNVTLTYNYDNSGNRTSLSDSSSGSVTYTYNGNFQLTNLGFAVGTITANVALSYGSGNDALSQVVMSSGGSDTITSAYSYGATSLAISYSDTASNSLPTFTYTLNNLAQVTSYNGPAGSSGFTNGTLTYAYDSAGELTGVTGAETFTYGFDNNGNRNSTGYTTTTGNQMINDAAGDTLTYDHNGNLSTKTDSGGNVWTYTWDYRNRLTQVVEKNGSTTVVNEQMTYDVFGNMIGLSSLGTQQFWTVFDGKNPYMDFNGSGTLTTRYLTNPQALDQFYARVASGGTVGWYLTDMTGSIREIVDGNGNVKDQINYDPFGGLLYESSSANGDRFKFDGGEYDANLKLYHFGDRWQDPANGRWISQDPVGFGAGDPNLYRFTNNDPVNFTDPTGDTASVVALLNGSCSCNESEGGDWGGGGDGTQGNPAPTGTIQYFPLGMALAVGSVDSVTQAIQQAILSGNAMRIRSILAVAGSQLPLRLRYLAQATASQIEARALDAARLAARLNHVFGNAGHNLEPLLSACSGSQQVAFGLANNAAVALARQQGLANGVHTLIVNVRGLDITVRGIVSDGIFRTADMWIPAR